MECVLLGLAPLFQHEARQLTLLQVIAGCFSPTVVHSVLVRTVHYLSPGMDAEVDSMVDHHEMLL